MKPLLSISQAREAHMPVFFGGFPWIITTQFPWEVTVKSSEQEHIENITMTCVLTGEYCEYRGLVVVWSTVVEWLSRSPVGVAEQAPLGPLEMTFRVWGQTHPKVNTGIVKQGGDKGCEGENPMHQSACVWSNSDKYEG